MTAFTHVVAHHLKYDANGLITAVVQDANTKQVLMVAWMNEEAVGRTLGSGETWFWSRSRQELWHKGAISGNTQKVSAIYIDCDADTLLIMVEPNGPPAILVKYPASIALHKNFLTRFRGNILMTNYQLAQLNIARMLAESDNPIMADFFAQLDEINALAERTPGFVWRLQTEAGDATEIRVFEDTMMIVNMSVWDSVEALYQFTYYSAHTDVYRRRSEWFHKLADAVTVMWWIPAGTIPTLDHAKAKLEQLRTNGATPGSFTFKTCFDPQGQPITAKGEKVI